MARELLYKLLNVITLLPAFQTTRVMEVNKMKRLTKAVLLPVRNMAYRWNRVRLFYWADRKLYALHAVRVMPFWYYQWLYHACLWLVKFQNFRCLAYQAIHTIPYQVRFQIA
jgi:hypothetical protein